jgi:hypothetical protein
MPMPTSLLPTGTIPSPPVRRSRRHVPPSWSPDGATILLLSGDRGAILLVDDAGPARIAGSIATGDPIETNSPIMGTFQRVSWQRLAP